MPGVGIYAKTEALSKLHREGAEAKTKNRRS
jgi:hypothetical protein